jgi:hypothetical protein
MYFILKPLPRVFFTCGKARFEPASSPSLSPRPLRPNPLHNRRYRRNTAANSCSSLAAQTLRFQYLHNSIGRNTISVWSAALPSTSVLPMPRSNKPQAPSSLHGQVDIAIAANTRSSRASASNTPPPPQQQQQQQQQKQHRPKTPATNLTGSTAAPEQVPPPPPPPPTSAQAQSVTLNHFTLPRSLRILCQSLPLKSATSPRLAKSPLWSAAATSIAQTSRPAARRTAFFVNCYIVTILQARCLSRLAAAPVKPALQAPVWKATADPPSHTTFRSCPLPVPSPSLPPSLPPFPRTDAPSLAASGADLK